jgi:high frequency lysogenization protein
VERLLQDKLYKTTVALAGMVQAICLVKELAQTGKTDDAAFSTSIYSIFQTEPADVIAAYGKLSNIKMGVEQLITIFSGEAKPHRSLLRYLMSLIHLQNKIQRSQKIRTTLAQRISQAKKQSEYFSLTHTNVIVNLADIYMTTISVFKFRIMIWGNPRILNASETMEKIRALLLAGIRSAVLWKQVGGSRLQLLFSRTKIKTMAEKILSDIHYQESLEKETT